MEPNPELPGPESERSWLRRHSITPRKRLGQNFLVQPQAADRLVRAIGPAVEGDILEIGSGSGAMTRALLDGGARVWGVEIDPRLVLLLGERFRATIEAERLRIISADVLRLDPGALPGRLSGFFGAGSHGGISSAIHLAGNLPYAITTPILLWTLENRSHFSGATFLIQREVAERLAAPPGSRAYGSITVWVGWHGVVTRLAGVEPGAFWPVPQVDSSLISIRFHPVPPAPDVDPGMIERVLSAAFGQRRKMLRSSLATLAGGDAERILVAAGIDPTRRAETLSIEEFGRLARAAADHGVGRGEK
jgi:16S rRNA (adenine1518-N6/adenine1519-N6)-dimethyltransferase